MRLYSNFLEGYLRKLRLTSPLIMSDAHLLKFKPIDGHFESEAYSKLIKYKIRKIYKKQYKIMLSFGIAKLRNSKGILRFANNNFFDLYFRKELKFQIWDYIFLKIPGFPGFPEAF